MKIKVMIAEDEKLARDELEYMLEEFEDVQICPSVSNGEELLEKYSMYKPDVIFVDIQMPELERNKRMGLNAEIPIKTDKHSRPSALKVAKLLLDAEGKVFVVDPNSIYYVMRDERIVRIVTGNKEYQSKLTLQELEDKLLPYHFFRSHRSYLVNLQYVEEIIPWFNGAYNLTLKNIPKLKIPVSRAAAKELLKRLQM